MTTTENGQRGHLALIIEREQTRAKFRKRPTDAFTAPADAIYAAGYRKPRTITTVEELDALPEWSVVRSEQATIWEKLGGDPTGSFWAETLAAREHPSDHIALPATVLYEPEAEVGA